MKTPILTLLSLLCLSFPARAQDSSHRSQLSLSLGLSLPHGDYWSTNFNNDAAGYATQGLVFDLAYDYRFHPMLGFTAMMRSGAHGFDIYAHARDWSDYLSSSTPGTRAMVDVQSGAYSAGGLLAGMYASVPLLENLQFQPRVLLGLGTASLPHQVMEASAGTTPRLTVIRAPAATFSFAWILGASAQLDLTQKIFGRLSLDAYGTNARWRAVQEWSIGHATGTVTSRFYDHYRDIRTMNISAGLGLRF